MLDVHILSENYVQFCKKLFYRRQNEIHGVKVDGIRYCEWSSKPLFLPFGQVWELL